MDGAGQMIRRGWRTILATSLILISATAIIVALYQYHHNRTWASQLRQRGDVVEAVVSDVRGSKTQAMSVRFEYNGRPYHGAVDCSGRCTSPGGTIHIWVNSAIPSDFATEDGTLSGNRDNYLNLVGIGGFVMIVLTAGAVATYRRIRRDKATVTRRASRSANPKRPTPPPRDDRLSEVPSAADE